jgi:hypothetical protein
MEHGDAVPTQADVLQLLDYYGAGDQREEILVLLAGAGAQEWFDPFRDVIRGRMFADHLLRLAAIEGDARVMKLFESDLIPGLLQTDEYTDAVCAIVYPERTERERSRFVDFRRARKERVLGRPGEVEISIILNESAIVRQIGNSQIMQRQLRALLTTMSNSTAMEVRVAPLNASVPEALGGPFSILKFEDSREQDVVYLEGREGAIYLEASGDVLRYEQIFSRLERGSLSLPETVDRITGQLEIFS